MRPVRLNDAETGLQEFKDTDELGVPTLPFVGSYAALGTTPAQSGIVRIPNLTYVTARDFADGADVQVIGLDGSDQAHVPIALKVDGEVGFNGQAPSTPETYTETNVTTDRAFDANATTLDELADVLGTLIGDLRTQGLLS